MVTFLQALDQKLMALIGLTHMDLSDFYSAEYTEMWNEGWRPNDDDWQEILYDLLVDANDMSEEQFEDLMNNA